MQYPRFRSGILIPADRCFTTAPTPSERSNSACGGRQLGAANNSSPPVVRTGDVTSLYAPVSEHFGGVALMRDFVENFVAVASSFEYVQMYPFEQLAI